MQLELFHELKITQIETTGAPAAAPFGAAQTALTPALAGQPAGRPGEMPPPFFLLFLILFSRFYRGKPGCLATCLARSLLDNRRRTK